MKKALTSLQLRILDILWDRGEVTVNDVLDSMKYDKDLARTTISTILTRMEKQGLVGHRKREVAHIYYSLVTRDEVRRSMVTDLVEALFKGRRSELVSHLLSETEQDAEVIRQIMDLLHQHESGKEET